MEEEDRAALVYTTFPSAVEAGGAGRKLVEARLAACVNIFPDMTAIFEWEGKVEEAREAAMIVKTRAALADEVMEEIKKMHPYATPALLVIGVEGGAASYMEWIMAQTRAPG
jgi:periplasmic divalent cation tolerance protein